MMSVQDDSLMTQAAVAGLRRAEAGAVERLSDGRSEGDELQLCMHGQPLAGRSRANRSMRLWLHENGWQGDVRARVDEALPFVDDAFRTVLIEHVLEWTPLAVNVLDEAVRVLASDGILLISGFHPFSLWMPWLLCRKRPRPMLTPPAWVRQRLAMQGVDTLQVERCGPAWPMAGKWAQHAWAGGGFVLMARKQRAATKPLASVYKIRHQRVDKQGAWVPGTQRECA